MASSRSTPQHRLSSSWSPSDGLAPPSLMRGGHKQRGRRPAASAAALHMGFIHLLCCAAALGVLYWCVSFRGGLAWNASNKDLIFNVHPVLMVAGFIVIYSEANLAYKMVGGTKSYKKLVHLVLQGAALVLGCIGVIAAFKFHNEKGIDNLYSLHSWLGMLTIVAFAVQWLVGFIVFWYPGGASYTRARMQPWHVFLGLFIYGLALTSAETGLLEKLTFLQSAKLISRFGTEAMFVNALGLSLVVIGPLVIWATLDHEVRVAQLIDK
ncbi:hypothetical protein O6H91_02G069000 [Diphasiastrum complanatum]|uniref:Uncharacterized protein n=1 Tax=Diphasiastrum complanatum TaxID=34168 RepID=A0ACC2EGN2_DIPCM|nr:hypothetical protein O6H91_02G069000 [Diphasiastrum complanatum]